MSVTEHATVPISSAGASDATANDVQQDRREALHRELHDQNLIAKKNKALAELIQSWIDDKESADEQRETLECLMRALDEDRLSDRKLFP